MSCLFDAAILFSGDLENAEKALSSLGSGTVRPEKVLLLCAEGEGGKLAAFKEKCELLPLPFRDSGLYMAAALRRTEAPFLLFLTDRSGFLPADFAERLLSHFEADPACEAAFSGAFRNQKSSSLPKAFYDALLKVCPCFGKEQIIEYGPQLFFKRLGAAMFRRELLTACPPEVEALTPPERLLTARAVYRDSRVYVDYDLRTEEHFGFGPRVLFHDAFCYSAASRRLYYQVFGIGIGMSKSIPDDDFIDSPIIKTSMSKAYGAAGKKAKKTLLDAGAFYKLPALYLTVLSAKIADSLGVRYHRLPAWADRIFAGGRYF